MSHPANQDSPRLRIFLWRFFTGNHLDGRPRTNATWFRRGTAPSHHVNWWNAKPRFHRAIWRWALVLIPTLWLIAYHYSPVYGINLTLIITLCALPYVFHHGIYRLISLIPRHRVVFVQDNVRPEEIDTDLDDIAIADQIDQDPVQAALDEAVINAAERKGRRS